MPAPSDLHYDADGEIAGQFYSEYIRRRRHQYGKSMILIILFNFIIYLFITIFLFFHITNILLNIFILFLFFIAVASEVFIFKIKERIVSNNIDEIKDAFRDDFSTRLINHD